MYTFTQTWTDSGSDCVKISFVLVLKVLLSLRPKKIACGVVYCRQLGSFRGSFTEGPKLRFYASLTQSVSSLIIQVLVCHFFVHHMSHRRKIRACMITDDC